MIKHFKVCLFSRNHVFRSASIKINVLFFFVCLLLCTPHMNSSKKKKNTHIIIDISININISIIHIVNIFSHISASICQGCLMHTTYLHINLSFWFFFLFLYSTYSSSFWIAASAVFQSQIEDDIKWKYRKVDSEEKCY